MVEYPYGRSGEPLVYYQHNSTVPKEEFQETEDVGDNEVQFGDDGLLFVYEAPAEDDPGRGHYSVWEEVDDGASYDQIEGMSGDDGMMFEKFQNRERMQE